MKLLTTLFLCLSAQEISEEILSPDEKKFSAIVRMVNAKITTNWDYSTIVKRVQNYGCHCFPGMTRIAGGQGAPVDMLDSACQDLFRCHRCVQMMDAGDCDTAFGKYKFSIDANGNIDCSQNTDCKLNQCLCDAEFAENLGTFWNDKDYNTYFWLAKKNVKRHTVFDYETTCRNSQANNTPDSCCGTAQFRRPYSSDVMQCCDDGSLKTIGSC